MKGTFDADSAVEVATAEGGVFAKGLARIPSGRLTQWRGRRTDELPEDLPHEVVHRDDLVLLG